jgi:cobaltochelatase CobT
MQTKQLTFQQIINKTASAITLCHDLNIEFSHHYSHNFLLWNQHLISGNIIKAYYPQQINKKNQKLTLALSKASVDMACCYLLFCNLKLHQKLLQRELPENIAMFDEFEKIRLLLLAEENYLGISKNIALAIENFIHQANHSNIALLLLNKYCPDTVNFGQKLALQLPKQLLAKILTLKKYIHQQQKFAQEVSKIIANYQLFLQEQQNQTNHQPVQNKKEVPNQENNQQNGLQTSTAEDANTSENQQDQQLKQDQEISNQQNVTCETENYTEQQLKNQSNSSNNQDFDEKKIVFNIDSKVYKIFNSNFDEVIYPAKFLAKPELDLLLNQLMVKIATLKNVSNKISVKFKQKLLSKKNNILEYQQCGVLNRKKLTQLVLNPTLDNIFIDHKNHDYQNTTLTLLLDNSGSMRGSPIIISAMSCQIIATILERFGVKTEIIGFTTVDWKGGKVKKLWELSGRPAEPGRLNQLRHIIYKHSRQSFKQSKINLGLMLKEGLLKENIDGEALLFAKSRLMQQPEKRKILVVISDGNPVDDSTNSANSQDILSWHLQKVIWQIEKQQKIEVIGIGIGHDLQRFYKNYITIDNLEDLGNVLIAKISDAL